MSKIKGFDFGELSEHFGIEVKDEDKEWRPLKDWLNSQVTMGASGPRWPSEVVRPCREFATKLVGNATSGYMQPFYRGLSEVADDFTFMQLFTHCVGFLWV
jgi:hypothetical protein